MENTFTDKKGRRWECEVSMGTWKRLHAQLDLDILTVLDDQASLLSRLHSDLGLLVDCIWLTVQGQHDIDAEEFANGLGGDVLGQAADAWFAGLVDFFHDPQRRKMLGAILEKAKQVETELGKVAMARLAEVDPALEAQKLVKSFGSQPESLGLEKPNCSS